MQQSNKLEFDCRSNVTGWAWEITITTQCSCEIVCGHCPLNWNFIRWEVFMCIMRYDVGAGQENSLFNNVSLEK